MHKRLNLMTLLALIASVPLVAQISFGQAELMNDDWLFLRVDTAWNITESAEMNRNDYDDSQWRRLSLPHDWSVELPMSPDKGSCQGYLPGGIGWYRRHLTLQPREGEVAYIYFEGAYNHSEVYLNGHLLGRRPSGFASFYYNLTPHLRSDGDNVLAVRIDHSEDADSRWYTGSGINRDVWLIRAPEVHLAPWGTTYRLKSIDKKRAVVEVDVETTDERATKSDIKLKAVVELKDADGNTVATTSTPIHAQEKKTVLLKVSNPQRWTLDRPYLYKLVTRLENTAAEANFSPFTLHSSLLDISEVKTGLRTLEFSPEKGFALNGKWMKVKGVCLHDDAGCLGTAVPREVWRERLVELKRLGANAIRMSHNPHAPMVYDLCDELGLLIMDEASDEWEFPKRKWLKGWNKGVPGFQGTYTYFEEWIERDVADMVRRDRCHPSVFMWSIGNEVDYPNDPYSHPILDGGTGGFTQPMYGGYKPQQPNAERIGRIAQRLAAVVRSIDTSRPTTGALAGVVMSNETAYPSAIDVVGYNYTESRYEEDHQRYPDRIIYGSENRHDLAAWQAVAQNDHIFGQFLWTGIDYLGESGPWPARGSSAGLLDLKGERKPIGWYRAMLWSEEPMCYVGTYPLQRPGRQGRRQQEWVSPYAPSLWNYEEGQPVRVVCYSNAPDVTLSLNGLTIAEAAKTDSATGIRYWDIDYQPGTLRAEAMSDDGVVTAVHELKTCGQPQALRLNVTRHKGDRVAIINIEAVDADGHPALLADGDIMLSIEGPARLLGMENGDLGHDLPVAGATDHRRSGHLRLNLGRLTAYVALDGTTAPVTIRATSPLLRPAEANL
ncbi:MAG: DUF4982 domain-containing protein [Prevotella sp.]|nr:DUF4982 domain-containing protein [Prevotella sp.]